MKKFISIGLVLATILVVLGGRAFPARADATAKGVVYHLYGNEGPHPPVVLIHGLACDSSVWRFQVPVLQKKGRVIVMDLPGHGQSIKPHMQYTLRLFADSVREVMDKAGVDRAVLVGHSMGFSVARMFAIMYPARCIALADVDGVYEIRPESAHDRAVYSRMVQDFIAPIHGDDFQRDQFMQRFIQGLFTDETPERLRRQIRGLMLSTPRYVADSALENLFREEDWQPCPRPGLPVLAVYSNMAEFPPDMGDRLCREYSDVRMHVLRTPGHFLMMERPQQVDKLLLEFLDTLPSQESAKAPAP